MRLANRRITGQHLLGLAFCLPLIAYLGFVVLYPLGVAVRISFYDYFFAAPGAHVTRPFIGLDNYTQALADPKVLHSFRNSLEFLVISTPVTIYGGLALASALQRCRRGSRLFQVVFFLPFVTSSVALAQVLAYIASGDGLIDSLLGPFRPDPSLLSNAMWAMPVVAVFVTWKQLGFFVVLYLAALQSISNDLYEAAECDGAGVLRRFWHVTVPGCRRATTLVILFTTISAANLFTEPFLLTGGAGPEDSTLTPAIVMFTKGIAQGQAGYASALGLLIGVFVLVVFAVQRAVFRSEM